VKEEFLKLKRKILINEYQNLNEMQREAVFRVSGPSLILAGAGSGKTTVLVNKIAYNIKYGNAYYSENVPEDLTDFDLLYMENYIEYPDKDFEERIIELISDHPAKPYNILAITFTNKAANELKERLRKTVGESAEEIWAGTFHSTCVKILRRYIEKIGYSSDFTIYDTDDTKKVIKDCLKKLNLNDKNFPINSVLSTISKAKDTMTEPEQFIKENGFDYRLEKIGRIYKEYQRTLREANALDFDDLLMLTVKLFESSPEVLDYYQNKFKYIYVDEYQDTNRVQYRLVSMLADKYKNLTVVGDDDQSIYKFRGATIENILTFENQYKNAQVIRLEQNYRSTGIILDSANSTIKNNRGRKGKTLWTENEQGEKIKLFVGETEYDEGIFIASEILNQIRKGKNYKEFAILYRNNSQSSAIEEALLKSGVPYKIFAGMKFYERKEIKDIVAYLSVITNPLDNLRLKRIVNEPKRGIGEATIEAIEAISYETGLSMYTVMKNAAQYKELDRALRNIEKFVGLIEDLKSIEEDMTPEEFVRTVLEKSGYLSYIKEQDKNDNKDRLSNLEVFVSNVENYSKRVENPSITGFLQEVSLASELDALTENGEYVTMMTIHSSKGLEFPIVFLTGMEDGIFPSIRSIEDASELEEERRLAYVAITRAKKQLYLTRARQRGSYYGTSYHPESRFLKEIPKENIENLSIAEEKQYRKFNANAINIDKHADYKNTSVFLERTASNKKPENADLGFNVGDRVLHATFGEGVVKVIKPMSGDALVEVNFDKVGNKKLMANYAKLTKV